jgi:hypothetical protein
MMGNLGGMGAPESDFGLLNADVKPAATIPSQADDFGGMGMGGGLSSASSHRSNKSEIAGGIGMGMDMGGYSMGSSSNLPAQEDPMLVRAVTEESISLKA